MGLNKIAILIDGGFFQQRFKKDAKRDPTREDVEKLVSVLMALVKEKNPCHALQPDILLRTFYYDCKPFDKVLHHPNNGQIDFSQSPTFKAQTKYLSSLDDVEQFALRLGDLSFSGWKMTPQQPKYIYPDFRQKGVDMKIGLDIAWMAGKKSVDKIVLVTGDSDFIAPMKLARREGITIFLYPMNNKVKADLVRHADFIIGNQPPPPKKAKKEPDAKQKDHNIPNVEKSN